MSVEHQPAPPAIPDYELIRVIGRGSYGDVWLARGVTGVWRAIKIVWRERFEDAGPFEREFKGLKEFAEVSLGESIQMALLHVGRNDAAGFFYYVMELADDAERGRAIEPASYTPLTLAELRARRGRLAAEECVRYGVELARVLAGLHRRGLVQRDIKPSNMILVGGVPKLADIGLVAPTASARTFVGTEGYVPPEGPGAPSADVFALGKVLYELATGLDRQEFPQLPAALDRLPDHGALLALNEIILRACDPERERRYRDGAALLADLDALHAGRSPRARRVGRSLLVYGTAAAVLIALVAIGAGRWWRVPAPASVAAPSPAPKTEPALPAISNKSIAVLPFANMSDEKDASAFFADGMHEDILTNLALIAELRVVSRTSVLRYRATTQPARQIGTELGVAYLLEGSVRRVGNKVRVTGQLINARTDEHVWAKSYDRDLTDIFAIQAALAQEIAGSLSAALSPETRRQIDRRPTENTAAYDLFLQGRSIRNRAPSGSRTALAQAEQCFTDAVKLDPKFAAAWGELAVVHALKIFWDQDASAERKAQADAAIAEATRLAPAAPDVIQLAGSHAYYAYRDYSRAAAAFETIIRLQPNNPTGYASLALIQRRQGRKAESLLNLQRAVELDPGNISYLRNLLGTLVNRRRWDEALALQRRIIALLPGRLAEEMDLAYYERLATGSFKPMDDLLARLTPAQRDSPEVIFYRKEWAARRADYAEFKTLDQRQPSYPDLESPARSAINAGLMYFASGDVAVARARIAESYLVHQTLFAREPGNLTVRGELAWMEAIRGQPEEAVRLIRGVVAAMPESRDALDGLNFRHGLAEIYAMTGDPERAIAEITRLKQLPTQVGHVMETWNYPAFKSLRSDPRFQAIVNDPKNYAPLP